MIAHTLTEGAVIPRLENRVIMVGVGIAAHYGSGLANLVVEGGSLEAMHSRHWVPLPGPDLTARAYLAMVLALEPGSSRLWRYVESMG